MPNSLELAHKFRLEEYKALRKEIEIRIKEIDTLTFYCLIAVAAIYGASFPVLSTLAISAEMKWMILQLLSIIAVFFPFFGLGITVEVHRIIYDIADYVKLIENECYSLDPKTPKATGWQNFSDCKQKERMCQDFRTRIVDRYIGPKGIMASVNKWLWLIFII